VESAAGHGATFTIYLPRVTAPEDDVGAGAASSAIAGASGTILFVEDDESIRALGARALRQHGYTVLAARHGAAALKLADRHGAAIDLLLTDNSWFAGVADGRLRRWVHARTTVANGF